MTTTKQPQQEQGEVKDMEPITSELLQKRYKLLDDYTSKLSDSNIKNGLDPSKASENVPSINLVSRDKFECISERHNTSSDGCYFSHAKTLKRWETLLKIMKIRNHHPFSD